MYMKKLLTCLLVLVPLWAAAQADKLAEQVKANPNYLWGQGFGVSVREADQAALSDLMSKISVQIESDFVIDEREVNTAAGNDATSTVQNVVRTYSQGTLKNTHSIILKQQPQAEVLRYIDRSEIEKAFKEREENVLSYVYQARNAE